MRNINCQVIRSNQDVDFHELSVLVRNTRDYLNTFLSNQGGIIISSFEISPQLVIPLQKLDDELTVLFKNTESAISNEQRKYLTICKRMVAIFYCYIHRFVELQTSKHNGEANHENHEPSRKLAFEFYFNAAYELRTPYFVLKGYSQSQFLNFQDKVYTSPLVPENDGKVDKIIYWIDELGKFIVELPKLWKANEEQNAA